MLLDCFTFFRELDLLEGRLEYLYDVVDYFVIVEADITHAGNKKELNFLNNIKRYKPYLDKIIYQPISIDTTPFMDSINVDKSSFNSFNWKIENAQRSHIDKILGLFDNDTNILLSDLDEIPLKTHINECINLLNTFTAISLGQRLYYYNFNQYVNGSWYGTVLSRKPFAQTQGVQWLRNMRCDIPRVNNLGYHLSYWGGAEDVKIKIENFSHQELNNSNTNDIEKIRYRIENGLDPYDRVAMIKSNPSEIDAEIYKIFSKYSKS